MFDKNSHYCYHGVGGLSLFAEGIAWVSIGMKRVFTRGFIGNCIRLPAGSAGPRLPYTCCQVLC